jgi:hypothetical protein
MGKLIYLLLLSKILANSVGLVPLDSESDREAIKYFPLVSKKIERSLVNNSVKHLKTVDTIKTAILEDILFIEDVETLILYKITNNKITFLKYNSGKELEDISSQNPREIKDWLYQPKLDFKIPTSEAFQLPLPPEKKEEAINTPWYNKKVVWIVGGFVLAGAVSGVLLLGQGQGSTTAHLEYK